MQDWTDKLIALQDLDQRISRLKQQADSVPMEKEKNQALLEDAKVAVAAAKAKVQDDEKKIKAVSIEIETIEKKTRDFQSKSAMIKNNTDYKAALLQISECKDAISQLEDQQIELMEKLEASRGVLAARNKEFAATEARIREMQGDFDKRGAAALTEVDRLKEKRNSVLGEVPEKVLQRYERLRKSPRYKDGVIFVPVLENICGRCHMNITYQVRMDARKGQLVTCGNCGVLLYSED